jgi:hypothetical protein
MTPSGIHQVVHDRARDAGLPDMHPHQLPHAFASRWLAEGSNENERAQQVKALVVRSPRMAPATRTPPGCSRRGQPRPRASQLLPVEVGEPLGVTWQDAAMGVDTPARLG